MYLVRFFKYYCLIRCWFSFFSDVYLRNSRCVNVIIKNIPILLIRVTHLIRRNSWTRLWRSWQFVDLPLLRNVIKVTRRKQWWLRLKAPVAYQGLLVSRMTIDFDPSSLNLLRLFEWHLVIRRSILMSSKKTSSVLVKLALKVSATIPVLHEYRLFVLRSGVS